VRPTVVKQRGGVPAWVFGVGLAVFAGLLFSLLNGRRLALSAPTVRPRMADAEQAIAPAPPLYVPPLPTVNPTPAPSPTPQPVPKPAPPPPPQVVYVPQQPVATPPPAPTPATGDHASPVLVVDTTAAPAAAAASGQGTDATVAAPSPATRATMLHAKSTTVAQGTLIPAVLESALDSSRPGPARALVTQDVRGWDGTRILVPRGTKLFGEYHSDVQPGQSRVQIMWTRLVRPDGATMMLDSPAGDPQGRVGIKGKVNNHFFAKFGGAILQTGLDVGSNLASRVGGNSVVVAVPGSVINNTTPSLVNNTTIQPTIRVHEGTSISVFVAHDLDFTSVESGR
jgi:type IV secretion system protein VirB10